MKDPKFQGKSVQNRDTFGLQTVPVADTNIVSFRSCAECKKPRFLSQFYQKRGGLDTRCKICVLKSKARLYKDKRAIKKRAQKKERIQREITWDRVVESAVEGNSNHQYESSRLGDILGDFMMEVILNVT